MESEALPEVDAPQPTILPVWYPQPVSLSAPAVLEQSAIFSEDVLKRFEWSENPITGVQWCAIWHQPARLDPPQPAIESKNQSNLHRIWSN